MCINNDMKTIFLSGDCYQPLGPANISTSLRNIDLLGTIGIIEPGCDRDIIHGINYSLINEVDIILVLRCDHAFDLFGRFDTTDFTNTEIIETFGNFGKPVLFVTHDVSIDYGFPTLYYPIYTTITYKFTCSFKMPVPTVPRKYMFSCISNKPKYFRIANYILFTKSTYYNASLLTLGICDKEIADMGSLLHLFEPSYTDIYLNEISPILPIKSTDIKYFRSTHNDPSVPDDGDELNVMAYDNSAFFDSYVNVVTETNYDVPFISEKIIKPLLACQFFVVVAGKHTINLLRELGFDTYDDIIDHDMYDNSEDTDRIFDVHKLLNIIQWHNWIEIYNNTVERRQANRELIVSLHHETDFINKIEQHIRNYYGI